MSTSISKINSEKFGEYLFETLPRVYKKEDANNRHALERYIKSLSNGGFLPLIEEMNGLLNLNDPEKMPFNILEIVFEQYGFPIFYGIPEIYLRKLLPIVGDLYSRKGSISVIEYLTGIISDVRTTIEYDEDFYTNFHIDLTLDMTYDKKDSRDFPTQEQLSKIINEFVPFFIDVTVVIVATTEDSLSLTVTSEEYIDSFSDYQGTRLFATLNKENLLSNNNFYTNNDTEDSRRISIGFSDYAKDEIITNGETEIVEY